MEMECFVLRCCAHTPPPTLRQSQFRASNSIFIPKTEKRNGGPKIRAKLNFHEHDDDDHHVFQSAISRALIRFRETLRPEPLFLDPYAGCLVPPNLQLDTNLEQNLHHYLIGTKFIDDQLLNETKSLDGSKQVVLFTDGMDTRAYRLRWPSSTVIYDVSPQSVFNKAFQKLQDVGAKIPRSCLLLHVPSESSNLQQLLRDKGFNGNRPSIWVFEGLPVIDLASFREILFTVSNLAMKGCLFLGEFPAQLGEIGTGIKPIEKWMDELFMSYGFRVQIIGYNDVTKNLGQEQLVGDPNNLLFIAEHLRFSDDQMETWRREFQRLEEEGDEEGFEEL